MSYKPEWGEGSKQIICDGCGCESGVWIHPPNIDDFATPIGWKRRNTFAYGDYCPTCYDKI